MLYRILHVISHVILHVIHVDLVWDALSGILPAVASGTLNQSPACLHLHVQTTLHAAHLHVLMQVPVHVVLG